MRRRIIFGIMAVISGLATTCFAQDANKSTDAYQSQESFEREFATRLQQQAKAEGSEGVLLIGFQTFEVPEDQRERMPELNSHRNSMPKGDVDFYVAEDGSYMKHYFWMRQGVVSYGQTEQISDTVGIIKPNLLTTDGTRPDLKKLEAVGIKRSDLVRGTSRNRVTEDVVYYNSTAKVSTVYEDLKVVFFDFGVARGGCD